MVYSNIPPSDISEVAGASVAAVRLPGNLRQFLSSQPMYDKSTKWDDAKLLSLCQTLDVLLL